MTVPLLRSATKRGPCEGPRRLCANPVHYFPDVEIIAAPTAELARRATQAGCRGMSPSFLALLAPGLVGVLSLAAEKVGGIQTIVVKLACSHGHQYGATELRHKGPPGRIFAPEFVGFVRGYTTTWVQLPPWPKPPRTTPSALQAGGAPRRSQWGRRAAATRCQRASAAGGRVGRGLGWAWRPTIARGTPPSARRCPPVPSPSPLQAQGG